MGRKNKVNRQAIKVLYDVYGLLIISISIYIFICLLFESNFIIPQTMSKIIKGTTGVGSYIIPFFVFLFGLALIILQDKINIKLKFFSLCFIYLIILILFEIKVSNNYYEYNFFERIQASYYYGYKNIGGGAIGELITLPLLKLLGTTGVYLFSVTFLIINILILINIPLYTIGASINNKVQNIVSELSLKPNDKKNIKKSNKEKKLDHAKSTVNNEQDNKYIDDINKKIKILDFFKASEIDNDNKDISFDEPNVLETKNIDNNNIEQKHKSKIQIETQNKSNNKNVEAAIEINKKQNTHEYVFPPLSLLNNIQNFKNTNDKKDLLNNAKLLEDTLDSFGVEAKVTQVSRGPVITRYELQPSPGVKVSKIVNLSDDIALNLAAPAVRIEAPIPGKAAVGIEIPNKEMSPVYLREIIESKEFIDKESALTFVLGKDVAGNSVTSDLSKMPHLLIAGSTGSGKSVCINSLIISILYKASPEKVRLVMIDPKVVELNTYNGIPHLLIPVVTDAKKAAGALNWAVQEMTNRYKLFADNNVRNIESYNSLMQSKNKEAQIPQIVIIIDELADLMMVAPNDVEDYICRLAQMARAAGMHLVVATQRPSVDVLTGVIKANIPSRISFAVSSQIDSRTILDMAGAEKLLGKGDMLYYPVGESKPVRIQGAFVSEKEVEQVVEFVKAQVKSDYDDKIIEDIENKPEDFDDADELLPQAIQIVVETGQASISLLQRRLRIGYNRSARLIDSMEERGIIGEYEGSKPRQVLISKEEYEDML